MSQPMEDELGQQVQIELAPEDEAAKIEAPSQTEAPQPDDEEQHFVRIDLRKIPEELARLHTERPEAANTLYSHAGKRTADRYQEQIRMKDLEYRSNLESIERNIIASMPKEQIDQRLANDPQFRQRYAELERISPAVITQQIAIQRNTTMYRDMCDEARDSGLPEEILQKIEADRLAGAFDRDANGNELDGKEGLLLIQRRITKELTNVIRSSAKAPAEAPPKQVNRALQNGPDLSSTGKVQSSSKGNSAASYRQMLAENKTLSPDEIDAITREYANME